MSLTSALIDQAIALTMRMWFGFWSCHGQPGMYENGVKHSDTPDLIRHFWLADYPPATPVKRAFRSIGVGTLESLDCDLSPSVGSKS